MNAGRLKPRQRGSRRRLRRDDLRGRRVALDLGADLPMNTRNIACPRYGPAFRPRQNLAMGDNSASVPEQDGQEVVFLGRQLDRNAVAGDEALVEIDHDAVDLDALRGLSLARLVAQRGAQPRCHFADAEWLLDIIVGPEIERLEYSDSRSRAERRSPASARIA